MSVSLAALHMQNTNKSAYKLDCSCGQGCCRLLTCTISLHDLRSQCNVHSHQWLTPSRIFPLFRCLSHLSNLYSSIANRSIPAPSLKPCGHFQVSDRLFHERSQHSIVIIRVIFFMLRSVAKFKENDGPYKFAPFLQHSGAALNATTKVLHCTWVSKALNPALFWYVMKLEFWRVDIIH